MTRNPACSFLRTFALALFVSSAAVAEEATRTFLDDWLQAGNPLRVGCTEMVHKKTHEKIELVSLNRTADATVRGYRNRKTGEVIYSSLKAGNGDMMALKGTDGKIVSVAAADYEDFPANSVADVTGKLKYIILDDYDEAPEQADLKDAILFIPISGAIDMHPQVRYFTNGIEYAVKSKPACVVVIVDSPGGAVSLAQDLCNAIQTLRRNNIKVVSYVNGQNKWAMSCGAMVCLSCDQIVMSPHSKMGAAIMIRANGMNVKRGPADPFSDLEDKHLADFTASFRTYAAGSKFPEELAVAMTDKTLGAVALTVNGKTEVMSVRDAETAKAHYNASKTAFTEQPICPVGKPVVITAEEGMALHAVAGMADTPQQLAALISPESKHYAIYEPMDRFSLRAKPIMDQLHQLETNVDVTIMRIQVSGLTRETAKELLAGLDKMLDLQKRYPDFFDPDDFKGVTDFKTRILGLLRSAG